jgi:hypothetical protein
MSGNHKFQHLALALALTVAVAVLVVILEGICTPGLPSTTTNTRAF